MTKEDDEDFENSNKCWICGNVYVNDDVKDGGASHDCKGYSKTNNKFLKSYEPKQESKHLYT